MADWQKHWAIVERSADPSQQPDLSIVGEHAVVQGQGGGGRRGGGVSTLWCKAKGEGDEGGGG